MLFPIVHPSDFTPAFAEFIQFTCAMCGDAKLLTMNATYRDRRGVPRLSSVCKACVAKVGMESLDADRRRRNYGYR